MKHWLFSKAGEPSKTAFWFSATMLTTLVLVICITIRFLVAPSAEFTAGLSGIAVVLGLPNAILAGTYTWGKKMDYQNAGNGEGDLPQTSNATPSPSCANNQEEER